jgi:hypothetical protein
VTTRAELSTAQKPSQSKQWRWHVGVITFFALTAIVSTFPVIFNLNSMVYGVRWVDQDQHLWSLWQTKRALLNFENPYETLYLYYPFGTDLYLHALDLYDGIITIPLQILFGILPAYNLIFMISLTLTGYAGWLLCRYISGSNWAAIAGAFAITYNPGHFREVSGITEFTGLYPIIFIMLFAFKLRELLSKVYPYSIQSKVRWYTAGIALFMLFTVYKSYYLTFYTIFFTFLFGLFILLENGSKGFKATWRIGQPLLIGVGLGLAGGLPILIGTIRNALSPVWEAKIDDYDEFNFSHALDFQKIFKPLAKTLLNPTSNEIYNFYYLGISIMLLALIGWIYSRKKGLFWGVSSLIFIILACGPYLRWGDQKLFPLPYLILDDLPGISFSRDTSHFMLIAAPCLGVLVAFGALAIANGFKSAKVAPRGEAIFSLLVLLVLFIDLIPLPPDVSAYNFPPIMRQLKNNPGAAVMDLPFTPHYRADEYYMANATQHQRPIFGGYLSRERQDPYFLPDNPFYNFRDFKPAEDIVSPGIAGNEVNMLSYFKVGYVIVYKTFPGFVYTDETKSFMLRAMQTTPMFEDGDFAVFEVPMLKKEQISGFGYVGLNWEWLEKGPVGFSRWMRDNGNLIYYATGGGTKKLTFTASSFNQEREFELYLNGARLTTFKVMPDQLQNYSFDLPVQEGRNEILFKNLQPAQSPQELGLGNDPRKLSIAVSKINFQ